MNIPIWAGWPLKLCRWWQEVLATRVARAAISKIGLPWNESQPGVWSAYAAPRYGYPVRLDLFTKDELIICTTRAAVTIDRPWIPQALAIRLLEENNRYVFGSNRLLDGADGMSIVHSHVCDARRDSARRVADVGRTIIRQMDELVIRLFAEDLILSAPELFPTKRI